LLEVLREFVIIVDAIKAEFDIWLNLLIILHKLLHTKSLHFLWYLNL
jgi:hypothetical protein